MVKVWGTHHAQSAMRVYMQRRINLQKRELAREEEKLKQQLQADAKGQLPEYDVDDYGRFAGYDAIFRCEGDNYEALHRVLKKIMRPAHYRTWAAINRDKGNGPPPCLNTREIAGYVGRHQRTVEIDLREMRKSQVLHIQPVQRGGRWVVEMHYDALYRLVYEYLEWERSADYIPAERIYMEHIQLAPNLKRQLLQFEDYRKVLEKKKPGPKSKETSPEFIFHQPYVGGRSQHIHSASPVTPTASQGAMERSIYSESPARPALPQTGQSGSAHPNHASKQPISHKHPSSVVEKRVPHEHLRRAIEKQVVHGRPNNVIEKQASHKHPSSAAEKQVAHGYPNNTVKEQVTHEHPNNAVEKPISHKHPSSVVEKQAPHGYPNNAVEEQGSQECASDVNEQETDQAYTHGSVSQEVSSMPVQVKKFTFKDQSGNSYVYPTSSLPMFFVDFPEEKDKYDPTEAPYYVDKEDILHIKDYCVPFLRDILICTNADYDHSFFHHRTAFEPEIQRLFDPKAVGVWAAHAPEVNEILLMMEYNLERNNVNDYMAFLAKDMESILYYQDEDLKKEVFPFNGGFISVFEVQEDAVKNHVVPDEPLDLSVEGVWTPELSIFVEFGHRATRFFIPHTDFPPEVDAAFPDCQVGVWLTMRPDERDAYAQPCYELFMEGIKAQPAHNAIVEARIRYLKTLQPQEETSMPDMEDAMPTPRPEHRTDEMPVVSTTVLETQEVTDDYVSDEQEVTDDYVSERQEVANDYPQEQAGTAIDLTVSGEALMGDTDKVHKIGKPINKAEEQELHCDRSVGENEPAVSTEQQHHNPALGPIMTGALGKLNLAHRSLSRRIVGNRRGTKEQEPKKGRVFVQVQEMVHDGIGGSYPAVVPLLQDFIRIKLLSNDTERRYFIPYTVLKSPDIGNEFPSGTDGVWLWKQPDAQIVHVKPSCMTVDPYLKNRSVRVIAVGKVVDDDGYLYYGKTEGGGKQPSETYQPVMENYGNGGPGAPPLERSGTRVASASRDYQPRVDDYGKGGPEVPPLERSGTRAASASSREYQPRLENYGNGGPGAPPLERSGAERTLTSSVQRSEANAYGNAGPEAPPEQSGGGRASVSNDQRPRVDDDENIALDEPPKGQPRMRRMSASKTKPLQVSADGMPSGASPPLSVQQSREQYQAMISRMRTGHGKGFQRLF